MSTHWAYFNEFNDLFSNTVVVDGAIITEAYVVFTAAVVQTHCEFTVLFVGKIF